MVETLANIEIDPGEWVDVYGVSGVAVGLRVSIENVGVCDVYLSISLSQPPIDHDAYNIIRRKGDPLQVPEGSPGAWVFCNNAAGKVNVALVNGPVDSVTIIPNDTITLLLRDQLVNQKALIQEIRLLNARVEDSLMTGIELEDLDP